VSKPLVAPQALSRAVGVPGVTTLTRVDVLLGLVQEILDNDAALGSATLPTRPTAVQGPYTANAVVAGGYQTRVFDADELRISYYLSVVGIDSVGQIAGVYVDQTYPGDDAEDKTTKMILGPDYGMRARSAAIGIGAEWYEQVLALSDAIVKNQGLGGFTEKTTVAADKDTRLDQVAGTSIKRMVYLTKYPTSN
jgi:hypothetical protein